MAKFIIDKKNKQIYYQISVKTISSPIIIIQLNLGLNGVEDLYLPLCNIPNDYDNNNIQLDKNFLPDGVIAMLPGQR